MQNLSEETWIQIWKKICIGKLNIICMVKRAGWWVCNAWNVFWTGVPFPPPVHWNHKDSRGKFICRDVHSTCLCWCNMKLLIIILFCDSTAFFFPKPCFQPAFCWLSAQKMWSGFLEVRKVLFTTMSVLHFVCMWFFPSQWQATIYPLLLTALLYLGPLVMAAFDCFTQCAQPYSEAEASGWSVNSLANLMENINTLVSNILAWRNYVVVSASFVITILFFSPLHITVLPFSSAVVYCQFWRWDDFFPLFLSQFLLMKSVLKVVMVENCGMLYFRWKPCNKQLACFFHPSDSFRGNSSHLPALMIMIVIMTHLRRVWAGTCHRGVGVSSMYGTSAVVWRIQPSLCCISVSSILQPRWESFPIFRFDDCGGLLKSSSRRPNNILILPLLN